jgi:periplasmic glucans biosynthesis protein
MTLMHKMSRRALIASVVAASGARFIGYAAAQTDAPQGAAGGAPPFGYQDVVKRARDLAAAPYDAAVPPLPDGLANLDFDAWRDIHFKSDKALLGQQVNANFRLELFHLGHLYKRPVVINVLRDGIPAPIPYTRSLFDYGRTKVEGNLPVNIGFAGFRLRFPLNAPHVWDEVVSFLGASYFRFLGRGQRYGLSARGLAIAAGPGLNEEFPFFREFWIDTPDPTADHIVIYALLDSESATGAFRFDLVPGQETYIEASVTLFARKVVPALGLAPSSSMFFVGKIDHRFACDFRGEVHDSDGLLMHTGTGEWIWRPLSNSVAPAVSVFLDRSPRGFGLLQRDRDFSSYQDLELAYELRPSYWIEPREGWAEGSVELLELPTSDETNDNIVAAWAPKSGLDARKSLTYGYRITALTLDQTLTPAGRTVGTYRVAPRALGAAESPPPGATRFLIDFSGGDLSYYMSDPSLVETIATASNGRILRTFLTPNAHSRGFRAGVDVAVEPGQSTDLRVFLRAGTKALTETWTFPWRG